MNHQLSMPMKNHTMMIICNKDVKNRMHIYWSLTAQNEGNTPNILDKKKGRKDPSCNFYVGLAQLY